MKVRLREEVRDIVWELVADGKIDRGQAATFLAVAPVERLVELELRKRERERRKALPWWKRWLQPT